MQEIERTRRIWDIDYYRIQVDPGTYPECKEGSETIHRQLFNVMEPGRNSKQVNWRINELEH